MPIQKKGFTLIELLVVVAIIGLLASVVIASVNSARERGRIAAGLTLATNLYHSYGADADGVWNLDEGSGSVAHRSAGITATDGVITGATWVGGPNNNSALSFGAGQRVSLGLVTTNINVTVAAWIQTVYAAQQPAFSNRGNGLYFGTTGGNFFAFYNNSSSAAMGSIKKVNDGKWHHIVWTSDGSTEKMYIDGQLDSTKSQTRSANDVGNAYIGYDAANNEYFYGSISQVAVYTQALGYNEVQKLYASSLKTLLAKK